VSDWVIIGEYGTSNSLEMSSWEAHTTLEASRLSVDGFARVVYLAGNRRGFPDMPGTESRLG
jgi:hypothetical protein